MDAENQAVSLVGMDAHSEKIELCVTLWRHGSDPKIVRQITTTLEAMEKTYAKQVPPGSTTVLEASTNSFAIVRRLEAIGQTAVVLPSDVLAGMARKDRINDRIDAANLAAAYARSKPRTVFVPSVEYQHLRDIFFGHRNAKKDSARSGNRLWSFCGNHGLRLPKVSFKRKAETIRANVAEHGWSPQERMHLEIMLKRYAGELETREQYVQLMAQTILRNESMLRLLTIPGIALITAFALAAFVEKIERFESASNLVSYIGLNPNMNRSGTNKGSNKVSRFGRRDLKALLVEGAQSVLRSCKTDTAKWGRRKIAAGKKKNVAICAVARKMTCHAWHALKGHPVPDLEGEKAFRCKLGKIVRAAGKQALADLGYSKPGAYIDAVAARFYTPRTATVAAQTVQPSADTATPPPAAIAVDRPAMTALPATNEPAGTENIGAAPINPRRNRAVKPARPQRPADVLQDSADPASPPALRRTQRGPNKAA